MNEVRKNTVLQKAVYSLVDEHFKHMKNDEAYKRFEHHMSPVAFAQEFKTIKVSGKRQTGHTTAALTVLKKYAKNGLFLVPFHNMIHNIPVCSNYKVFSDSVFKYEMLQGHEFDVIIFDVATRFSTTFKNDITYKFSSANLFLHLE